jgi:hypothetical protein
VISVFLRHELRTRLRSGRFAAVAALYLIVCAMPPLALAVVAQRSRYFVGPAGFAASTLLIQPLATAVLAAIAAADSVTREREEGSLAVAALAPLSAFGYVMRRWLAVLAVITPVTLAPPLLACALASLTHHRFAALAEFLLPWCVRIAPVLVLFSALALAIGTIAGQTVLAVILGAMLFTVGLGFVNDLAARTHRHFDGLAAVVMPNQEGMERLRWAMNGWLPPELATEGGYDADNEAAKFAPATALPAAVAILLMGIVPRYLRRTRADIRPWHIPRDSPFRTILGMLNRIRTGLAPDGMADVADRIALVVAIALTVVVGALLVRRFDAFARVAGERYRAIGHGPAEMSANVVPAAIEADVSAIGAGAIRSVSVWTLRNSGSTAVGHLAFEVSPSMTATAVSASRGTATASRLWNRLGVDVTPALQPRESRQFHFTLEGTPGTYDFPFRGTFAEAYGRFRSATTAVDLVDLSRSWFDRSVSRTSLMVKAADVAPVPRYTPWKLEGEQITPDSAVRVHAHLPRIVTADACGSRGRGEFVSTCSIPFASYEVIGGAYEAADVAPGAMLLYFSAYAELIPLHARALASALRTAREAWPGAVEEGSVVFIEEPTPRTRVERWWEETIRMVGRAYALPERMLAQKEAVNASSVATSLITSGLARRRSMAPADERAFRAFVGAVAAIDTGSRKVRAVVPGTGAGAPMTEPLLARGEEGPQRISGVVAELEHRVGHDRLKGAITAFVNDASGPGTMAELIEIVGRRAGVDLHRYYSDYFTGTALPQLTLAEVSFRREGAEWVVAGALLNKGTGESFCPVVLRTAAGSMTQTIRIDSHMRVPFVFRSPAAPRALQLDPTHSTYRYAAVGTIDAVDEKGPDA